MMLSLQVPGNDFVREGVVSGFPGGDLDGVCSQTLGGGETLPGCSPWVSVGISLGVDLGERLRVTLEQPSSPPPRPQFSST